MHNIRKLFKEFISLKVRESIEHMVVDRTQAIVSPLKESQKIVEVLLRSCELIRDNLMQEEEVEGFLKVEWCK